MITCPKCGADNMIGAIFCRTCGDRLELDDLTPDVFDAPPEPLSAKVGRILTRVIVFVLVAGGIALLAGAFWPVKIAYTGNLDQGADAKASRKLQAVQSPSARLPAQVPFTSDEVTALVNKEIGLPQTDAKAMRKPMFLSVGFQEGGNCTFVLRSLLFSQVPICTTVVAKPSVSAPGSVDFQIISAKMGMIPLPGGLSKLAVESFRSLNAAGALGAAMQNVKGVSIGSDSCHIQVR